MKEFLRRIYVSLFKINDTPKKISLGFGLGVFLGVLPATGPIATLFLAALFKLNKAASLLGCLLVNTWINVATFLLAIKIGSVIMGVNWRLIYEQCLVIFRDFHWINLFKLPLLKIILPLLIGYLIIGFVCAVFAYLGALFLLKAVKPKLAKDE